MGFPLSIVGELTDRSHSHCAWLWRSQNIYSFKIHLRHLAPLGATCRP